MWTLYHQYKKSFLGSQNVALFESIFLGEFSESTIEFYLVSLVPLNFILYL